MNIKCPKVTSISHHDFFLSEKLLEFINYIGLYPDCGSVGVSPTVWDNHWTGYAASKGKAAMYLFFPCIAILPVNRNMHGTTPADG
jgi:hypothetical protein